MSRARAASWAVLPALAGAVLAFGPAGAGAAPSVRAVQAARPAPGAPLRGLSDGRLLANADPAARAGGIAVARAAGARVARIPIGWSAAVRNETFTRPSEAVLPLSDPAHPVYRWDRIDQSLRDLTTAGLTPLGYLMAAPPWAQSAPRYAYAGPGTWAPRPSDLAAFASAVARRYDGTYPDPLHPGRSLPRVQHFQTWNEPNLARYLQPQWVGVGAARGPLLFSARWYRRMHAAAYAAIHARQPDAVVGLAGLAPTGSPVDGTGRVGPIRFLRSLLCVDADPATCGPPLRFDAISLHPLSVGDPDRPAKLPDDIALADLQPKLSALLADARRAGRLAPGAHPPLWITELNWTSAEAGGIAAEQQPAVVGRAMLRLQQAGAALVNWQFATDPTPDRTAGEVRPAGLTTVRPGDARSLPGQPKPFLAGFAFPIAAIAVGGDHTYVWAMTPAGSRTRRATIERRSGGRWRPVAVASVRRGGVLSRLLAVREGQLLRVRAGAAVSPPVRSTLRLALAARPAAAPATRAAPRAARRAMRLQADEAAFVDPRPSDPDGPGFIPALPPLVPGGTPPSPSGRPNPPVPAPSRPARRLVFQGTAGADVIIGSSGADRLAGGGGNDLLIGLGGDDRFDAGTGADILVRGRRVEQR